MLEDVDVLVTGRQPGDASRLDANAMISPFTTAGGSMAALISATDWTNTGVGPRETWPASA